MTRATYRSCWPPPCQVREPGRAPTHQSATLRAWRDWWRATRDGFLAHRRVRIAVSRDRSMAAPEALQDRVVG